MAINPVGPRILKLAQEANGVAAHPGLSAINFRFAYKLDDEASHGDAYAMKVVARIGSLLPCTIQDHPKIRQIRTSLAEAKIFYRLRSTIPIRRVLESEEATPDFEVKFSNGSAEETFPTEIKAPDLLGGEGALDEHMERALGSMIEVEGQLNEGRRVGVAHHLITPWAANSTPAQIADRLIDKLRQNIKGEQFRGGNGILAVDLPSFHLPLLVGPANEIRRFYPANDHPLGGVSSGILWHVAFGRAGERLYNVDGRPGAALERDGIMHDYSDIRVLTFCIDGPFFTLVRPLKTDSDALLDELICEFSAKANDETDGRWLCFQQNRW